MLWANTLEIQTLTGLSITKATEPKLNNFHRRSLIQLFSPWKHIQFLLARPQALLSFIIHSCLYILSFFGFLNFTLPKHTFFTLRPEPRHFWDIFFYKKIISMLACRVVCRSHQSDRRIGYVSRTNQTAALRCVFRTNHITAFRYHAPITVFEYCFLVNDVMESWGCAQRMTLTRNFRLIW